MNSILKSKKKNIKNERKTRCTSFDAINTLLEKQNHVLLEIANENCNQCNANRHEIRYFAEIRGHQCQKLREMSRSKNSSSSNNDITEA